MGQASNELLGTDGRPDLGLGQIGTNETIQPLSPGPAKLRATDRRRVATLGIGSTEGLDDGGRGRITRRPDREIDHTPIEQLGFGLQIVEPIVGIGRGNESH